MNLSRRTGILAALGSATAALAGCTSSAPAPTSTPSTGSAATPSAAPSTLDTPSAAPSAAPSTATPTPTPKPTPKPTATAKPLPWAGVKSPLPSGPVNVLIVGTDNTSNTGNTDVLVVAQLSAARDHVTLVGIPRDSYVRLASGGRDKVNSALYRGGISNTKATVSDLFGGLKIHYVAQCNFATFIGLCKLINGFGVVNKISSSVTSKVTGHVTYFRRGKMVKYGADWLIYARQRKGLPQGEFDRGERHRAIVTGMTQTLKYLSNHDPQRLAKIAKRVFDYVNIYGGINEDNILGVIPALSTLPYDGFTSLKVPHAGVSDIVTLDYGQLGDLATALRRGNINPYLRQYGLKG